MIFNYFQGNPHRALIALRQSLKLWNRAYETLLKHTRCGNEANTNPFDMGPLTAALPTLDSGVEKETYRRNPLPEHINWRIAEVFESHSVYMIYNYLIHYLGPFLRVNGFGRCVLFTRFCTRK